MEALIIEQTETCPSLTFDPAKNIFEITGVSGPEDVRSFYYPVIEWLGKFKTEIIEEKRFVYDKDHPLDFNIELSYFNSSSAKFLFDIFSILCDLYKEGQHVKIYWFFEEGDDDLREAGEDMSELLEIPFNYIAIRNRISNHTNLIYP